jgi:hypothetical protein
MRKNHPHQTLTTYDVIKLTKSSNGIEMPRLSIHLLGMVTDTLPGAELLRGIDTIRGGSDIFAV